MASRCGYRWQNDDPDAERDSKGKKLHPFHRCVKDKMHPYEHQCSCFETRSR